MSDIVTAVAFVAIGCMCGTVGYVIGYGRATLNALKHADRLIREAEERAK